MGSLFPDKRIATAVAFSLFSCDMQNDCLGVTEAERRVSGNLLNGLDFVVSSNPRGNDIAQILCEHIWRGSGNPTLATDGTLHDNVPLSIFALVLSIRRARA